MGKYWQKKSSGNERNKPKSRGPAPPPDRSCAPFPYAGDFSRCSLWCASPLAVLARCALLLPVRCERASELPSVPPRRSMCSLTSPPSIVLPTTCHHLSVSVSICLSLSLFLSICVFLSCYSSQSFFVFSSSLDRVCIWSSSMCLLPIIHTVVTWCSLEQQCLHVSSCNAYSLVVKCKIWESPCGGAFYFQLILSSRHAPCFDLMHHRSSWEF